MSQIRHPQPGRLDDTNPSQILARITPGPSPTTETETHVIYMRPRITAALLARYIVSEPSAQKTILKNSKYASKGLVRSISKAKVAFAGAFSDGVFDREDLARKAEEIRLLPATGMKAKDNQLCSEILKKLATLDELPEIKGASRIPRPQEGWAGIHLGGVEITFEPQVVFSLIHRDVTKVGAVAIHANKSTALDRGNPKSTAGHYYAALLVRMLETKLHHLGAPSPAHTFVIDVHRSKVFTAPQRFKSLFNNLEAACEMIASRWVDVGPD